MLKTSTAAVAALLLILSMIPASGNIVTGAEISDHLSNLETHQQTIEEKTPSICVLVEGNGNKANIDLVFVPTTTYGTGSDVLILFSADVDNFFGALSANEDFSGYLNRINVWRINEINPNDRCVRREDMRWVCDQETIDSMVELCGVGPFGYGMDQKVVLFNDGSAHTWHAAGENWANAHRPFEFSHSLGVSLVHLTDEYLLVEEDGPMEPEFANAASDQPGFRCSDKWGDLIDTGAVGCFLGCSFKNWYRPTEGDCEMYSLNTGHFCPVCSREVDKVFEGRVCAPGPKTLCLNGGRFKVQITWTDFSGNSGDGQAVGLTDDSGYFWFFDGDNIELVVKVLDACHDPYRRFWVFAAGLTNVEVWMTVIDTVTQERREYYNPSGTPFDPILDTNAFATCP